MLIVPVCDRELVVERGEDGLLESSFSVYDFTGFCHRLGSESDDVGNTDVHIVLV